MTQDRRDVRVQDLYRDTITPTLRKMLVIALAIGCPSIVYGIVAVGPTDAFVRWCFPPLLVHMLLYAWVLVRRPAWAIGFSRATLVVAEAAWVAGMVVTLHGHGPDAWYELFPTSFMGLVVFLVVGFLVHDARRAVANLAGVCVAVLVGGLVGLAPDADPEHVRDLVRYVVYLVVIGFLLHVLSHAKARLALAVSAAQRATDEALHLRDMAYRDALTGIANRRRLVEELTFQAERAGPENPVTVVYFDLDHFKAINDELGHTVGDEVLCRVAEIAARVVRQDDVVGRLGGEEFVIVLPGTPHDRAMQLAERLRTVLRSELEAAMGLPVTASFGVVRLSPGEGASAVLARVDVLMYEAKSGGRNRVVGVG